MSRRCRKTLLDWNAINPERLLGRWFLLQRPKNEAWRGFVQSITIEHDYNHALIEAIELQFRPAYSRWFSDHAGPMPPFSIGFGQAEIFPDRITWRCGVTKILFLVPHTPPRSSRILEPRYPRIDPSLLRSSGGAYLRKHL